MKNIQKKQQSIRIARSHRVRASLLVTPERPRLSVFRSLKHISGQIIDHTGRVLCMASDKHISDKKLKGVALATAVGKLIAENAQKKKISTVVFDKGHYAYHGRVKAFADGAREGGLSF